MCKSIFKTKSVNGLFSGTSHFHFHAQTLNETLLAFSLRHFKIFHVNFVFICIFEFFPCVRLLFRIQFNAFVVFRFGSLCSFVIFVFFFFFLSACYPLCSRQRSWTDERHTQTQIQSQLCGRCGYPVAVRSAARC